MSRHRRIVSIKQERDTTDGWSPMIHLTNAQLYQDFPVSYEAPNGPYRSNRPLYHMFLPYSKGRIQVFSISRNNCFYEFVLLVYWRQQCTTMCPSPAPLLCICCVRVTDYAMSKCEHVLRLFQEMR